MEQLPLAQLQTGMRYEGFLLVRSCEQRKDKNGNNYLDMKLSDQSGEMECKLWDRNADPFASGTIIKVRGSITEFNGRIQLKIERIRPAAEEDAVDRRQLIPCAPEEPKVMMEEINRTVEAFESSDLKKLTREMLRLAGDRLMYFPAAQRLHHAEYGGLLHHTTGMLRTAEHMIKAYPFLNGDLLRAGVIMHDLGKIQEMDSDASGSVRDYTADGLLLGHLVRGVATLQEAAKNVGVEGELVLLLEHMIISHHGEAEFGSPRKPMFPEAEVLHWIDLLDARMNEMKGIMDRLPEGAFSEKVWSLDRRLYHPRYEEALPADEKAPEQEAPVPETAQEEAFLEEELPF
ncbi:MAG: OB-fold nucleic acid binding domain-containing protein [Clostridia bacterium]|nr:OB-fold nucleic acid binding domain-containing protein [Clostridia bacterium]